MGQCRLTSLTRSPSRTRSLSPTQRTSQTEWGRFAFAFAALSLAAACDSRHEVVVERRDVPTEATHSGRVVVLGDGGPRVEVLHDSVTGTVTVYTLRDGERVVTFEQAPVVEVRTTEGTVPVTLVRVEGETHVWRATHGAFKRETLADVRLVARADGRRFEQAILASSSSAGDVSAEDAATRATPASLPPSEPVRDDAAEPTPPASSRAGTTAGGTRTLSLSGGATAHLTTDAKTGAVSVHLLGADGSALAADKVVIALPSRDGAGREVLLVRAEDGTWSATDEALRAPTSARLVVTVAGKAQEVSLSAAAAPEKEDGATGTGGSASGSGSGSAGSTGGSTGGSAGETGSGTSGGR